MDPEAGQIKPVLFDAFPALQARVPHLPLGRFPTPIERACGILPPAAELWVMREDRCGAKYGGNKVRKLEFLLGAARESGAKRLVTLGGYGSHHVLATAIYGAANGFRVDAVVFPQPITPHVLQTIRAAAAANCHYHAAAGYPGIVPRVLALRMRRDSFWVAPGGSSPLGTLGWVSAGLELAAQIKAGQCPTPDAIYVALGSSGTAAGLLLGLRLASVQSRIIGVRVVDAIVCNRFALLHLARQTARYIAARIGRPVKFDPGEVTVDSRFFGGAYGRATTEGERALAAANTAGIRLETTYTGKTFAAVLADAQAGRLDGKRALFVDTFNSVDLSGLSGAGEGRELPPRLSRLFGALAAHT